jgi:YbbR domain-containing protein
MAFGTENLALKCVALGAASLLWLVLSGEQVAERALRIPLEYSNLPSHLELTGDQPMVVDVRLRGSGTALGRISAGDVVAVLDLQGARPGRRLFHLTAVDVRAPFGMDVVQVTPSNLTVNIEPSATKVVPVVPDIEGEPAAGYQVRTISADPATVEVVGPESALKTLTRAITEPVSVDGASGPIRESVNVGVPDPDVRLRTPQSAVVHVEITSSPGDRTIPNIPISARGSVTAAMTPAQVSVNVRGSRDALNTLEPGELDASVDLEGLPPGQYQLPVRVVAPERVSVVKVDPSRVQVRVK